MSDDGYSTDWSVESGLLRAIFNIAGEIEEDFQWEEQDEDSLFGESGSTPADEEYASIGGDVGISNGGLPLLLDEEESRLSHVWNVLFQRNLQSETPTDFGEP